MVEPARALSRAEGVLLALAFALTVTFLVSVTFRPSGTVDLWWTLQVGDHVRAHWDVPRTALWTLDVVRDQPYVCHSWLAGVVFSAVVAAFGIDAVPALPAAAAIAVWIGMVALVRSRGGSWLAGLVIAQLLIYPTLFRMIGRAEIFGYVGFTLALVVLATYARERRRPTLAWLVPIALVWVNSHASFLLLFGLLPVVAAGIALDTWRENGFRLDALLPSTLTRASAELGVALGVTGLLSLMTPYGTDLLRSVLEPTQADSVTGQIFEWTPLYAMRSLPTAFLIPAGLLTVGLAWGYRRVSFVSLGVLCVTLALAVSAVRHVPFFAIAAALLLGEVAAGKEPTGRGRVGLVAASGPRARRRDRLGLRPLGARHPAGLGKPLGLGHTRRPRVHSGARPGERPERGAFRRTARLLRPSPAAGLDGLPVRPFPARLLRSAPAGALRGSPGDPRLREPAPDRPHRGDAEDLARARERGRRVPGYVPGGL